MKYKKSYIAKKKRGFTIIESLVYIFLTTIILVEGINLYVLMYKSYIEATNLTIKYNNFQNFYINLDNIISEGGLKEAIIDDKSVMFAKVIESGKPDKDIKSNQGEVLAIYSENGIKVPPYFNTMLQDIDNLEVRKKGKLIYLIIHDKDGKEFIRCI